MASARSRLGAARRGLIRRQKKTDMLSGILGTAGTVAAFAGTQAKKAKTAWGEYEAGYKALGGEDFKKPGFWEKGGIKATFGGPGEGQVEIGKGRFRKSYDIESVRKVGGVLGSDIGSTLSDTARKSYMERTAPGKAIERKSYPESFTQLPSIPEEDIGGVDPSGSKRMGFDKPATGPHMVAPDVKVSKDIWRISGLAERAPDRYDYRGYQQMFQGSENILSKEDYDKINAANLRKIELQQYTQPIDAGPQIPKQHFPTPAMSSEEREIYETSGQEQQIGTDGYRKQWENISDEEWEESQRSTGRRDLWESLQLNNKNRRQY